MTTKELTTHLDGIISFHKSQKISKYIYSSIGKKIPASFIDKNTGQAAWMIADSIQKGILLLAEVEAFFSGTSK